jgi:hypothetical protein
MDFDVLCVDHVDQMGPIALVFHVLFVVEVDQDPPMMASTVDFASSTDLDIGTVINLNEVYMSFGSISRPIPHTFGCCQSS